MENLVSFSEFLDARELAEKYRRQRNQLKRKCDHLEHRQDCNRKRIGELKNMLLANGIEWNEHNNEAELK